MKILSIISVLAFLTIASCTSFLDSYPNGDISGEELWDYQNMVQGLVGQCYDYMPRNYNDNEGAYLDCATDDAVITSTTSSVRRLATGTLITGQDIFYTYWERDYRAINLLNTFLKDRRGYLTRYMTNPHYDTITKNRLQGEAFALRAWFQWDLLEKFGGKGVDGRLLGYPIVLAPIDPTQKVNLQRDSYDDCVHQIIADCDSAYKYLQIANRDFLVTDPSDLIYGGGKYWGRMDGITTRAIKAKVYLTWASPRFNISGDISRWDSAAKYSKLVMDFKLTTDATTNLANPNRTNAFIPSNGVNWFNPNFPGIILSARYLNNNDAMERMFYPGGFLGNGVMGATQDLVDAFPMENGYPIDDPANRGGYDPAKPFDKRDKRFYSAIFHNNAKAIRAGTATVMYTFENHDNGGKDAAGAASQNSRTNYHIKKFVYMGLNWSDASIVRQPHSKFFLRWAEMCLIFAEAANHVTKDPNTQLYGMAPITAIQHLRGRKTYDGANGLSSPVGAGAPDSYLQEVANRGEESFDMLVRNERRLETCFEGRRFYDLRRWSTDLTELNKPVHMVKILKNPDNTFTYTYPEVESRIYNSAYLPIPYSEILKMSNLIQNEGWEGWY